MTSHKYIRDTGILNTDKNRFYSQVIISKDGECLEWKGTLKNNGYGQLKLLNKKWVHAHRLSYEYFNGNIDDGLCVLHSCDNRKCVNPSHLLLGTNKDNTRDMLNKRRNGDTSLNGERNPKAKLKEKDIIDIKHKHMQGINCTILSKQYNVAISCIDRIVRGVSWKYLNKQIQGVK